MEYNTVGLFTGDQSEVVQVYGVMWFYWCYTEGCPLLLWSTGSSTKKLSYDEVFTVNIAELKTRRVHPKAKTRHCVIVKKSRGHKHYCH